MNLSRCENGHFFDKEKYAVCPHCSNAGAMNDGRTFAFDATEEITEPTPIPAPQHVRMEDNLPLSGMDANDLTMPGVGIGGGSNYVDTPTLPLEGIFEDIPTVPSAPPITTPSVDEDDDHTIGFFDIDFAGTPAPAKPAPQEKAAPVAKAPIVSMASTPCVGWLIAIGGKHIGTDFRLKAGKNYVGRNASNDIALPEDMSVSREKHAIVVYEPKNHLYFIQPGESSSLVYKNDELVLTPMMLKAYDIITIGEINLMFMPLCGENFNWTALFEEMKRK